MHGWLKNEKERRELLAGVAQGGAIAAVVLALAAPVVWLKRTPPRSAVTPPAVSAPDAAPRTVDFGHVDPPPDVRRVAGWAVASGDTGRNAFAIVDKRRTHLYVFDGSGRLRGDTPVLLGYAPGDDTVPGIGQRPIEAVQPAERTTPAGRFDAASGRNLRNEDVVWVDYEAAVSMHRVLTTNPAERRLERLATPTTDDNRISYGCINVPVAFFEQVVWPSLGKQKAVVYVLPEVRALEEVFPQAARWGGTRPAAAMSPGLV